MLSENIKIAEFYDKLCEQHGPRGWEASHWADSKMQQDNFDLIIRNTMFIPCDSDTVLDVGCGQADLFDFFMGCQNIPHYHGIDISANMIAMAKNKYGMPVINKEGYLSYQTKAKFEIADFDEKQFNEKYDWVYAIGAFNYKTHEDQHSYVEKAIVKMYNIAKRGIAFTLLKDRGYNLHEQYPYLHPFSATRILEHCLKLTPYVTLNHSHLSSEFAVFMFKEEYLNTDMTF